MRCHILLSYTARMPILNIKFPLPLTSQVIVINRFCIPYWWTTEVAPCREKIAVFAGFNYMNARISSEIPRYRFRIAGYNREGDIYNV